MKSLDGVNKKNDVNNTASEAPEKNVKTESEKIDFSKVKIEPLFEEMVDFDTFSKSDFRAVKVKECVADISQQECRDILELMTEMIF